MSNKNLVQITTDEKGLEIVMVRADKTLKEITEEKPSSRWNPAYWHPKYEKILITKYPIRALGDYCAPDDIIYRNPPKSEYFSKGLRYLLISNTNLTGMDLFKGPVRFIREGGSIDVPGCRLSRSDILIARSGASIGNKFCYFINDKVPKISVSGDFAILRNLRGINPSYVYLYLLTNYSSLYFDKLKNGVGVDHLNADEIRSINMPELPKNIQTNIDIRYQEVSKYHDKAMEAKKNNDEAEYKNNIQTAEKMLKDLIVRTEAVIQGDRKDVI